jgi:hypothetical protein
LSQSFQFAEEKYVRLQQQYDSEKKRHQHLLAEKDSDLSRLRTESSEVNQKIVAWF